LSAVPLSCSPFFFLFFCFFSLVANSYHTLEKKPGVRDRLNDKLLSIYDRYDNAWISFVIWSQMERLRFGNGFMLERLPPPHVASDRTLADPALHKLLDVEKNNKPLGSSKEFRHLLMYCTTRMVVTGTK
jgi:hypothetical protein